MEKEKSCRNCCYCVEERINTQYGPEYVEICELLECRAWGDKVPCKHYMEKEI